VMVIRIEEHGTWPRSGGVFLGLLGGLEFFEYLLSQPVIFLLGNELFLKQVVQLFKTVGNR